MAVQLAARAGAEVIGVCSPASVERAYQLGCCRVLDYNGKSWERMLAGQREARIDRVLDLVGGCDIEEAGRRVLEADGAFVTVVGPEHFIGDRALGWVGVLAVLARVGYRIISSRIRGPRYDLTGPSLTGGKGVGRMSRQWQRQA